MTYRGVLALSWGWKSECLKDKTMMSQLGKDQVAREVIVTKKTLLMEQGSGSTLLRWTPQTYPLFLNHNFLGRFN